MIIQVSITGTSPLLMHNERLADSSDSIVAQIKEITSKKTHQTDSDKELCGKLEWYGGLYENRSGDVGIPVKNIIRCFAEAGATTRSGKKVFDGVQPSRMFSPLIMDGSRHKDNLWNNPIHTDRRGVRIGKSRIMRVRPVFPQWGLLEEFELREDVLSFGKLCNIAELAGRTRGLGDARSIGHGRFSAKVTKKKTDA